MTLHVSTSFRCDRETRELGEAYPALSAIDRAYQVLVALCEQTEAQECGDAKRVAYDLRQCLGDARHDASFGETLERSKDAYAEARVVRMVAP